MAFESVHDLTWRKYMPFASGVAAGEFTAVGTLNKFGYNPAINTDEEVVWDQGSLYVYPGSAQILKISSEDTGDDVAGAGARTVQIYGLDANFAEVNETLDLDGQNVVSSTNIYQRIFRMVVRTAGATGFNEGEIYAGTGTVASGVPDNIHAMVSSGQNQTLMAVYTVPVSKQLLMTDVGIASFTSNGFCTARLVARPQSETMQNKMQVVLSNAAVPIDYSNAPLVFDEKTDIEVRARSNTGNLNCAAVFNGYLVNK